MIINHGNHSDPEDLPLIIMICFRHMSIMIIVIMIISIWSWWSIWSCWSLWYWWFSALLMIILCLGNMIMTIIMIMVIIMNGIPIIYPRWSWCLGHMNIIINKHWYPVHHDFALVSEQDDHCDLFYHLASLAYDHDYHCYPDVACSQGSLWSWLSLCS